MIVVFLGVILLRFLLPLLIPRHPLPAIVGCLVIDALDQTIFQSFGYDPPGYQGYDKAMDVYYLAIAYLTTLRNWESGPAFAVGRFLYFYRLVGVVAFEITEIRALLLIFPNTFEYYFIAYEAYRSRWSPLRLLLVGWVAVAAVIWVAVKLPQEYWIHIAQLDVTDLLADRSWAAPLLVGLLLMLAGLVLFVVRPRTPPPDWPPVIAAPPLPEEMDEGAERTAWQVQHGRVWSRATLEKVVLVGLLCVIFAHTLPGIHTTDFDLAFSTAQFVVLNAAITLVLARRSVTIETAVMSFVARLAINGVLLVVSRLILGPGGVDAGPAVFFVLLVSLLTTLHDRWLPVHQVRSRHATIGA